MNITHATHEEVHGDRLYAIFQRQQELWDKYHHIEVESGARISEHFPVNLHDRRDQLQIKDYAWRVIEEVGEAIDASKTKDHYQEELVDGLHFLTELTILVGMDWNQIIPDGSPVKATDHLEDLVIRAQDTTEAVFGLDSSETILPHLVSRLVVELGMMCNCLKNKPWKQSMMMTDEAAFYGRLREVWGIYVALLVNSGLDAEGITDTYLRKSQVNKFRQRSQY